ncbi:hypothetical protein BH09MYX1_BH09MYX1_33990 [soil metagenome]
MIGRSSLLVAGCLVVSLVALNCTKEGQSDTAPTATASSGQATITPSTWPSASAMPAPSVSSTPSAIPTPTASGTAAAPGTCTGLEKNACVLQPGCILDQNKAGFECRAGKNACELAVRHADVIGMDVKGVTETDVRSATAQCKATTGCTVAGGKCACTCAIFGNCNCICGGGWLPRCTPTGEASKLDGFPGKP